MTTAHDAKAREITRAISNDSLLSEEIEDIIAAALRGCEREALERAAKVADACAAQNMEPVEPVPHEVFVSEMLVRECRHIAARIRALGTNDTTG